jgi:predicted transposase
MKLTAKIKLKPDNNQTDALRHTLSTCNAACNHISQVAWDTRTFSRNKLHHLVYYDVRARFGLSAQATVRCIAKSLTLTNWTARLNARSSQRAALLTTTAFCVMTSPPTRSPSGRWQGG